MADVGSRCPEPGPASLDPEEIAQLPVDAMALGVADLDDGEKCAATTVGAELKWSRKEKERRGYTDFCCEA